MVEIVVSSPLNRDIRPSGETPEPGPGEILLWVARAGICGSDIHILHGSNPFARYPRIIGHEFAGHVAAIGPEVTGWSVVSDMDAARLERARGFGAATVLNPRKTSVPDAVRDTTEGLGPTVVIDGAGIPALLEEVCRIIAPAGRIGLLGFSSDPCNVSQQQIVAKELTLVGSRLNRRFIPTVVGWLAEGRLQPGGMITHTFAAAEAGDAFHLVETEPQRTVKVQLDFAA